MSKSHREVYSVSKIPQLIPLNGELVNFEAVFRVKGEGSEYNMLIVTQGILDSTPLDALKYKQVQGEIMGDVKADSNVHEVYYLIIKADVPSNVEVEIDVKSVPGKPQPPPVEHVEEDVEKVESEVKESSPYSYQIILLVFVALGVAAYFLLGLDGKGSGGKSKSGVGGTSIPRPSASLAAKLKNLNF